MDIIKSEKFRNYFLYFVMYSVIGWIYEVFLEVVIYRWGFSNRGLLFGPYCPIYGVGAIVLIPVSYTHLWEQPDHFRIVYLPEVDQLEFACSELADFLSTYHQ